jgi:hypothetical protein
MKLLPILIYTAICIAFFKNFSDVGSMPDDVAEAR